MVNVASEGLINLFKVMQVGEGKVQFIPGLGHDLKKRLISRARRARAEEIMWDKNLPSYQKISDFSNGVEPSKRILAGN